mmetsp:Transcript_27786/g.34769  ORF Transcript_27786/g.34769 Transcript_27786/m.34769 type:complete len:91 (+) Transcript_27786:835-1107(+)
MESLSGASLGTPSVQVWLSLVAACLLQVYRRRQCILLGDLCFYYFHSIHCSLKNDKYTAYPITQQNKNPAFKNNIIFQHALSVIYPADFR